MPPFSLLIVLALLFAIRINKNNKSLAYIENNNANKIQVYDESVKPYKEETNNREDVLEAFAKADEKTATEKNEFPKTDNDYFNFTALGEIMMGGGVVKPQSGSYTAAFSSIAEYVEKSDYVVANFTTNITDKDKISNGNSKYLVTKKILNAFNALEIKGVNVANDHALDFGIDSFNMTKSILKDAKIDIIGLKDDIVYVEKKGIKIAIIAMCNQVIGKQYYYEEANLSMYNLSRIKKNIEKAEKNADMVIVMNHSGLGHSYRVTSIMNWLYKKEIEYGADIILGGHALGVYPIEIYNDKPIIYSLGYLMHDTNMDIGKESGMFNFKIDKDGKLIELEVIPTYIIDKEKTVNYFDYDRIAAKVFLNRLSKNIDKENSIIEKDRLVVTFNNK